MHAVTVPVNSRHPALIERLAQDVKSFKLVRGRQMYWHDNVISSVLLPPHAMDSYNS